MAIRPLSGKCLFPIRTAQITWYSYFTGCWWQSARKGSEIIGMRACANTVRHKAYKNDLTWSKSWSKSRDTRSEHICKVTSWFIFTVQCALHFYIIQYTYFRTEPYISVIIMLRVYREHIVLKVSGRGRTTDEISLLTVVDRSTFLFFRISTWWLLRIVLGRKVKERLYSRYFSSLRSRWGEEHSQAGKIPQKKGHWGGHGGPPDRRKRL